MRVSLIVAAGACALMVTACSSVDFPTLGPYAPVTSSAPGASSQMPQSANSLPPGATVNAPLAGTAAQVGISVRR